MARNKNLRYNLAFKLKVIKYAEAYSINKAHKIHKVSHKQIRWWISNKQKIMESPNKVNRARIKKNGTPQFPNLEIELKAWILEQRLLGFVVDGKSIKQQAAQIAKRECLDFKASNGWFSRFLRRSNFVLRRITTSGRDLPNNSREIVLDFINKCRYELVNTQRSSVINLDETSIYLDAKCNYTYDQVGAKRVPSTNSGNEKTRISVCFAASASGYKFKPLIIVPRVNPLKDFEPPNNVVVIYNKSGTFNEDMICDGVIKRCLVPKIASKDLKNPVLILDQAPCHATVKVKETLAQNNIKTIYVPKRFTNLLQPADVSWMRPLKKSYFDRWQNWLINEEKSFTAAGNLKSPGYSQVIIWISEIWEQLEPKIISESFDRCGVTSKQAYEFHVQLQSFIEKNKVDMIDDYDQSDDFDAFNCEEFYSDLNFDEISENESESE